MKSELRNLSNPRKFHNPISINNQDIGVLKNMLSAMFLIRKTEQQIALGRKNGVIGGPVHLGVGQEIIVADVSKSLQKKTDRVYSANRCRSHALQSTFKFGIPLRKK